MLDVVTEWPGRISGISYKSGRCDGCVMSEELHCITLLIQVAQFII